jgi:hypothetical protein
VTPSGRTEMAAKKKAKKGAKKAKKGRKKR